MYQFGIGGLFAKQMTGNAATPNTLVRFGTLQDVSVDITQKLVQLRGQNKFPDDIAPGDMEMKGKAAFGNIQVNTYNTLFFADTVVSASSRIIVESEAHSVGNNNYLVTVTNGNNFYQDLNVRYADGTGDLRPVTSGQEAVGTYSVGANNGVYTFAAADAGKALLFSYVYNSTSGKMLTVANHLMGYGPVFELWLSQNYQNAGNGMHIFACRSSKMSAPLKRDNYMIADFEFECYPNASGNVFEWFQTSA